MEGLGIDRPEGIPGDNPRKSWHLFVFPLRLTTTPSCAAGCGSYLSNRRIFQVVGEAEDGRQAVDLAASLHPRCSRS